MNRPASSQPIATPQAAPKISTPQILKDNRGSAIAVSAPVAQEAPVAVDEFVIPVSNEPLTLEKIIAAWDALTYAVSRDKMSMATYLQEGKAIKLVGDRLTIGFGQDHAFHKEALDTKDAKLLIDSIFSEKLHQDGSNSALLIVKTGSDHGHEPVAINALKTFSKIAANA
jgi:hypothetical protein